MNKEALSNDRRTYSSKLREEQAEQTRERIIAALVELLKSGDLEEISFNSVAKQAGVSVPTVYRYFPSRTALFDGITEHLHRELKAPPFPAAWTELAANAPQLFGYYESAADLFRAAIVTSLFREVQFKARATRDRGITEVVAPLTRHLDDRSATAVAAFVRMLFAFESYSFMNARFGLNAEEVSRVVAWVTRVLTENLASGGGPSNDERRTSNDEKGKMPSAKGQRPIAGGAALDTDDVRKGPARKSEAKKSGAKETSVKKTGAGKSGGRTRGSKR